MDVFDLIQTIGSNNPSEKQLAKLRLECGTLSSMIYSKKCKKLGQETEYIAAKVLGEYCL